MAYIFIISGLIAVFFPFQTEDIEPTERGSSSLLTALGGEGIAVVIRIVGGFLFILGMTMVFMN